MTRSLSKVRWSALVPLLVVCLADSGAFATPDPHAAPPRASLGDSLTGRAKDDYEAGRILFENGDDAGALVKFQHAYDLSSDSRLLWDMGACEKNLHHYVRVLTLVRRYVNDEAATLTDAQRAQSEAVIRTVQSLVSTIRLTANVPGASVFVDDALVGTTPLAEPLMVDLGERHIRVAKPGFKEQVITEHVVGASDITVSVALEREVAEGRLVVSTDAAAGITVDGAVVGLGRWQGVLPVGSHRVRVSASGMVPYDAEVAIVANETRSLEISLQHQAGDVSPVWWIGGSILAAAGLGVGGYFLLRPSQTTAGAATPGTISPYTITIQVHR